MWAECLVSIRFDVEEGPVVDCVAPPNALSSEGRRSVVRSAFPDSNFECEYHFMYYFTMRNVMDYDALTVGSPTKSSIFSPPPPLESSSSSPESSFGQTSRHAAKVREGSPGSLSMNMAGSLWSGGGSSPFSDHLFSPNTQLCFEDPPVPFHPTPAPPAPASSSSFSLSSASPPSLLLHDVYTSPYPDHATSASIPAVGGPPTLSGVGKTTWAVPGCTGVMSPRGGGAPAPAVGMMTGADGVETREPKGVEGGFPIPGFALPSTGFVYPKAIRPSRLYACAYYRQKRDPSVPRGSVQQVFVLLSSVPYHVVHELALRVVVPCLSQCCSLSPDATPVECSSALAPYPTVFFPPHSSFTPPRWSPEAILNRAYTEMNRWPAPHPHMFYEVPLLHQTLSFVTPTHAIHTNLSATGRSGGGIGGGRGGQSATRPLSGGSPSMEGGTGGKRQGCDTERVNDCPVIQGKGPHALPYTVGNGETKMTKGCHPSGVGASRSVNSISSMGGRIGYPSDLPPLFSSPDRSGHSLGCWSPPHTKLASSPTGKGGDRMANVGKGPRMQDRTSSRLRRSREQGGEKGRGGQTTAVLPPLLCEASCTSSVSLPCVVSFSSTPFLPSSSAGVPVTRIPPLTTTMRAVQHGRRHARWSGAWYSHELPSVIPLFALLHAHLDHLTRLWELVISHQSICILSDTSACAAGVAHAISSLIAPLPFTGKLYSHVTSFHEDIERIRRLGTTIPFPDSEGLIVACTNRMMFKSFQAWPSWVVALDEAFLPPSFLPGEGGSAALLQHASSSAVRRQRLQPTLSKSASFSSVSPIPSRMPSTVVMNMEGGKRKEEEMEGSRTPAEEMETKGKGSGGGIQEGSAVPDGTRRAGTTSEKERFHRTSMLDTPLRAAVGQNSSFAMSPLSSVGKSGVGIVGGGARRGGLASRHGWPIEMEDWDCAQEYHIESSSVDTLSPALSPLSSPRSVESEERETSEKEQEEGWEMEDERKRRRRRGGERGLMNRSSSCCHSRSTSRSTELRRTRSFDNVPETVVHRCSPSFGAGRIRERLGDGLSRVSQASSPVHGTSVTSTPGSPTSLRSVSGVGSYGSRLPASHIKEQRITCSPPPPPAVPLTSSGEAAYYFHSGFTKQTLEKVKASQVPACLGPLNQLEAGRAELLQQCATNYFDAAYSFLLDHTTLQQSLLLQLEKVSGLDATGQELTMSLQLDQLYAPSHDGSTSAAETTGISRSPPPALVTSVKESRETHRDPMPPRDDGRFDRETGRMQSRRSDVRSTTRLENMNSARDEKTVFPPLREGDESEPKEKKEEGGSRGTSMHVGLKDFSASTVFSQQSVADDTLRRFFRSLTLEFLRPVDVWFTETIQQAQSVLEWCGEHEGNDRRLSSAQFMQFMSQHHRRVIGTSIKGKLAYASYQGIYEKFSKGDLFQGYLQELFDDKLRKALTQFSLATWRKDYPEEHKRRKVFSGLLRVVQHEMEYSMDPDLEFAQLAFGVLVQMVDSFSENTYKKDLEEFSEKWGIH